jgi:predicted membrane protein (TIGR00267 family)
LDKEEIVQLAKKNLENGERWHKKVSVKEIVFGFNDGSVSTLALLAGVTGGALARSQILVAGISGVVAGSVSMAVGAYISSKSEIDYHRSEIEREKREIDAMPEVEREELRQIYQKKADFAEEELGIITKRIMTDKKKLLDSMMKEELGLFEERFEHPIKVGMVMLIAFLAGGLIPVMPFLLTADSNSGFLAASFLTFASLFCIGLWKTTFTNRHWLASGGEMVLIGIVAAVIPYLIGDLLLPVILSRIIG